MLNEKKTSKTMNIVLWIVQVVLASSLLWGAFMKLFQPTDTLSAMWP